MPAGIVAPYLATLPASAAGQVESIQATNVAFTGIQYLYFADAALTSGLFSAFTVSDADSGTNANVSVAIDQDMFKAALRVLMAAAQGKRLDSSEGLDTSNLLSKAAAGSNTLDITLKEEIRAEIAAELNDNGVLETLEADVVNDLTMTVEWSNGAANMAAGLDNADLLKAMYLQLPQRAVSGSDDYNADGNTSFTFSQIMASGDRMAFVFSSDPSVAVTAEPVNVVTGAAAGTNGSPAYGTTGAQIANPGVTFNSPNRRIAFVITVA
jgi:hypothetical protein